MTMNDPDVVWHKTLYGKKTKTLYGTTWGIEAEVKTPQREETAIMTVGTDLQHEDRSQKIGTGGGRIQAQDCATIAEVVAPAPPAVQACKTNDRHHERGRRGRRRRRRRRGGGGSGGPDDSEEEPRA
jgi:hypothetical protein